MENSQKIIFNLVKQVATQVLVVVTANYVSEKITETIAKNAKQIGGANAGK